MFSLQQIKDAHSKVKSGADFPAYIQKMKGIGVIAYEHFVADGRIQYKGIDNYSITADPKWEEKDIIAEGSADNLQHALRIHQQGQTDYPTFCKQAAEAGVEKWIVNIETMTCTYYDKTGHVLLEEKIPG